MFFILISPISFLQDSEARRLKRGHVLSELLETERIYVTEMSSILKVSELFPHISIKSFHSRVNMIKRINSPSRPRC